MLQMPRRLLRYRCGSVDRAGLVPSAPIERIAVPRITAIGHRVRPETARDRTRITAIDSW